MDANKKDNSKFRDIIAILCKFFKKHPYKAIAICSSPVIAFVIIPLLLKLVTDANAATNDWISFWGGYIGALISIIPIILTIKYESKRWNIQNQIERQPVFVVEKKNVIKSSPELPVLQVFNHETDYEVTDTNKNSSESTESIESTEIGIIIENISTNYALDLRMAPVRNDSVSLFSVNIIEASRFSPSEKMSFRITLKYNKEKLLNELDPGIVLFNKHFIFKICYNTPFDQFLNNNITVSNFNDNFGRANKFNIYVMLFFDVDDNEIDITYELSTTKMMDD